MASEIKVPGVFTTGTGDHWGTTDGLKDPSGKMQSKINADVLTELSKKMSTADAQQIVDAANEAKTKAEASAAEAARQMAAMVAAIESAAASGEGAVAALDVKLSNKIDEQNEKVTDLEKEIYGNKEEIDITDTFSTTKKTVILVEKTIKAGTKFTIVTSSEDVTGKVYLFANDGWSGTNKVEIDYNHEVGSTIEYTANEELFDIRLYTPKESYGTISVSVIFASGSGIANDIVSLKENATKTDADIAILTNNVTKVQDEVEHANVTESFSHRPKNLINYDDEDFKEGYMLKNNILAESTGATIYNTSGYIKVSRYVDDERKVVNEYKIANGNNPEKQQDIRYINCYDKDKNFVEYISSVSQIYTPKENVEYIRITVANTLMYKGRGIFFCGETPVVYSDYFDPYTTVRLQSKYIPTFGGMRVKGTLANNTEIDTEKVNVAKNTSIIAVVEGTINNVRLGIKGDATADGNYARYLELTPTTYSIVSASGVEQGFPKSHGLTLGDRTSIVIDKTIDACILTITDEYGNTLTDNDIPWNSTYGRAYIENVGDSPIDANLSFMLRDINKDVWLFGSSYLGMTNPARWPYYLIQDGHTNWLMNAKPGESIIETVDDFKTLLSLGCKPKYVFLHCSQNGVGGDSEDGINLTWKYYFDIFNSICKENGITPVYYLPHNAGTRFNEFKKQYVISTGERYVDSDKPVQNGVDYLWKGWGTENALLSSDQTHPTERGAKVLYSQVIVDFPEILVNEK